MNNSNDEAKLDFRFIDAATKAIGDIADVAEKKGMKITSFATGVFMILAVVVEFLTKDNDYIPHDGELFVLFIGSVFVAIPIVLNELDYKWQLDISMRKKKLIVEKLRIEAEFKIAQLRHTKLNLDRDDKSETDKPEPPK